MLYRVSWIIDVEADSVEEAARNGKSLRDNLDPDRIDNVFEVRQHQEDGTLSSTIEVDLDQLDDRV
ncbi:MAG: hypothetical protein ACKO0Z_24895 [Betaproteobacteria bacterium]